MAARGFLRSAGEAQRGHAEFCGALDDVRRRMQRLLPVGEHVTEDREGEVRVVEFASGSVERTDATAEPIAERLFEQQSVALLRSAAAAAEDVGQKLRVDVHVIRKSRSVVHEVVHRRNGAATKARIAALEALVDALRSRALQ